MKKWAFLLLLCLLFGLCACGSTTQSSQEEAKAMEVENQALLDEIKAQDNYGYDNAFYEKHSYGRGSTTVLVDFDSQTMVQISIRYGKNGKRTSFSLTGYRIDGSLEDGWRSVDPDRPDEYKDWVYHVDKEGAGYAQYKTEIKKKPEKMKEVKVEDRVKYVNDWIKGKTATEIMKELRP